jgi:hypothetical protein
VRQLAAFLTSYLSKENLETAVAENVDLTAVIFNHFGLNNPNILPLFKTVMRAYWDIFEQAVTDVPRLYTMLKKKLGNDPILMAPETINYLNTQAEHLYSVFYALVWES